MVVMTQEKDAALEQQNDKKTASEVATQQPKGSAPETAPKQDSDKNEAKQESKPNNKVKQTRTGGAWMALIMGIVALALLLVFILQNQDNVDVSLFAWEFSVPLGVGFLFAALFGAVIMACVGAVRMFQLRRQIKKRT